MRSRRPLVLACLFGVLAAVLPVTVTTGASAATTSGVRRYAVITFDKNYANTLRSELVWRVFRVEDGTTTKVVERRWRAGSGFRRTATNACAVNRGWLPNGWYHPKLYGDYPGSLIKGRAIYLGNKRCPDDTLRTDLFIHTEQGAHDVQCADTPGDQPCRWEYPQINDYRSLGCVKLAPGDMAELYDAWTRFFPAGYDDRVRVHVVN
ncbi:MAG: hypothetical protein ACXVYW_16195 [Oryzihumus sp.]